VIKSELIDRISVQNPHLYRHDAEKIVNAIFSELAAAMSRGDRVELRGFGVFFVKFREGWTGRNPRTGALVSVESKAVPFFRTSREMRSRLNLASNPDTGRDAAPGPRP
jgi:integration host factor subunit beta